MDFSNALTERNVLSCLFQSRDSYISISDLLTPEDFAFDLNRTLYSVLSRLHEKRLSVDVVLIYEELNDLQRKQLDGVGGWDYLNALRDLPINPANSVHEAQELRKLTLRRRTEKAGLNIASLANKEPDIERVLSQVQVEVDSIAKDKDEGVVPISHELAENIQKRIDSPKVICGQVSGFNLLDQALQGFQDSELYVTGGRKKTGKSTLLINWAYHLSIESKVPVLWISTEHSVKLDQLRLLSIASEVPFASLNNGTVSHTTKHLERTVEGIKRIEESPFYFTWLPGFSIEKIKRITRRYVRNEGVRALFFDYIKPPPQSGNKQEWQVLGDFTYGLKELAGEEEIPIISAVQINREGAQAERMKLDLESDYFAGSDRIAQALSVAMVLRKPYKDEIKDFGYSDETARVLQVTDNRLGPSGFKSVLQFESSILKLSELARIN